MRLPARDVLLALAVVLLWGYNFVPIRYALDEAPPLALAALRFFLAAVPLVFFVPRPATSWGVVLGYGLLLGVGQFGVLFVAIAMGMPAGLASLVMQAQVFLTIAIAAWRTGERPTRAQLGGTLLAGAGLVVLAVPFASASAGLVAFALVLVAALAWACANVLSRQAALRSGGRLDAFALVVWASLAAPLPLVLLSYLFEGGAAGLVALASMSLPAWGAVALMTYGATHFGYGVWNRLLHRHPAAAVAPFALLVPVAGLASAWVFLGETLSGVQLAGAALVLTGLALGLRGERRTGGKAPREKDVAPQGH